MYPHKMLRKPNLSFGGFIFTFFGAILFSTKAIIVKKAFHNTSVDALTLLTLRMIFSLPFYLIAAIWAGRWQNNIPLTGKQWMYVIALGLFGYYLSSLFDFIGLQFVSAGLERLILFLYPTFTVLINTFFFKQKLIRTQIFALILTYAGIAFAFLGELKMENGNTHFYLGSFLIFLCSITYAIYIAGSGRIIPSVGVTRYTAYAMLASTSGVFIHFLLRGNPKFLEAGPSFWTYGLLLAIVATVIPTFMISAGMKRIGSNNAAIISAIGPVSTIIQAHFILDEKVSFGQVVGTILVILGVLLIGWRRQQIPE
jgi:drug/metabolite transporter (DMT)-like permease